MKNLIFYIFCLVSIKAFTQNDKGSSNDIARITLAAYVPEGIDKMPDAARSILANKLNQIITQNGMGGSAFNERFIITANVNVINKDLTPTAPPMTAFVLEVTLYIGDGIEGTKFSSTSISVKGVGENETKAYISALKRISPTNSSIQDFVENGKSKIIEYYNSKCMDAVGPIYQKQIDKECKSKLMDAATAWNASQDTYGADSAGQILSQIDSNAACYKEALALSNKIAQRVKEIDQRDWKFQLKQQQDNIDIRKATIKAARDIGVAYGNGQKSNTITYNVRGWW